LLLHKYLYTVVACSSDTESLQASAKLSVKNSNGSHYPVFQDMLYRSNLMGKGHVRASLCMAPADRLQCNVMCIIAGLASLV
jgi:hypothetical protein